MVQGAAKGGRQKEFDHLFFFFRDSFGHFLVTFLILLSLFSSLLCQTPKRIFKNLSSQVLGEVRVNFFFG